LAELGKIIDDYKSQDDPPSYAEIGEIIGKSKDATRSAHRRWKKKPTDSMPEQGFKWNEDGNTADIEFVTGLRITTLEQLLEAGQVDESIWAVDHWVLNKWEVGAKDRNKNLNIEPLFQVKAWLIKKVPVAIFPVIQPVQCNYIPTESLIRPKEKGEICTSLIWGDPHFGFERDMRGGYDFGYHNEDVLRVILNIAEYLQPDRMDIIGDILDLAEWSDKYFRSPEMMETTQESINAAHWWLKEFRAVLPNTEMLVYEGNHELRMRKALITHLKVAYGLRPADHLELPPAMSVESLLALDGLGIEWVGGYPDNKVWLNNELQISHGDVTRAGPGDTTKAISKDAYHSQIIGHIHRVEMTTHTHNTRDEQRYVTAFSPGCTCWCDNRVPGNGTNRQWQNGCGVVEYEVGGSGFNITPIVVQNGRAVYNGKIFEA